MKPHRQKRTQAGELSGRSTTAAGAAPPSLGRAPGAPGPAPAGRRRAGQVLRCQSRAPRLPSGARGGPESAHGVGRGAAANRRARGAPGRTGPVCDWPPVATPHRGDGAAIGSDRAGQSWRGAGCAGEQARCAGVGCAQVGARRGQLDRSGRARRPRVGRAWRAAGAPRGSRRVGRERVRAGEQSGLGGPGLATRRLLGGLLWGCWSPGGGRELPERTETGRSQVSAFWAGVGGGCLFLSQVPRTSGCSFLLRKHGSSVCSLRSGSTEQRTLNCF